MAAVVVSSCGKTRAGNALELAIASAPSGGQNSLFIDKEFPAYSNCNSLLAADPKSVQRTDTSTQIDQMASVKAGALVIFPINREF